MNSNVDLSQLAVRRDQPSTSRKDARSWHLGTRLVLPGIVLVGFLIVVGWAARDSLLPARPVTVIPVVTTYIDVQSEGTPLFQCAGWIEPRPTPILVSALTEGVVEKLLVVEGQRLTKGADIAQLIQDDARIALQATEAERDMRQAEADQAKASLEIAKALLPAQLLAARSQLALAQQTFDARKRSFELGAAPLLSLPHAQSELDLAASRVAELEIRQGKFKGATIDAFAEASAAVKAANARVKQADSQVDAARLRLKRTVIQAPVDGQVINLVARPGQRLMGQSAFGHSEASTLITMYDPGLIQVRADVLLEDVPKVHQGQLVKIQTPVATEPLDGEVLQITSQAEIQKNRLQVKVAVKAPPHTLRPDMLVQATFLAKAPLRGHDEEKQSLRVLIPKQLVETTEGGAYVWIADLANKVARKQAVKVGRASGDFVEITQGLNPADRLIVDGRHGLSDGQRIAPTHLDASTESIRNDGAKPKRLPNPAGNKDHSGKH